jgi:hypothetical protein
MTRRLVLFGLASALACSVGVMPGAFGAPAHHAAARWFPSSQAQSLVRASALAQAGAAGALQPNIATSVSVNDPTGDADVPEGDVVSASSGEDRTGSVFKLRAQNPTNPLTDSNWLNVDGDGNPETFAGFVMDLNFDGNADHDVLMLRDPNANRFEVGFFPFSSNTLICLGTGSFDGTNIVAKLGAGCPSLHAYKWAASLIYNQAEDDAPDFPTLSPTTPNPRAGYFMLGGDGRTYGFGNGPNFGGTVPFAAGFAPLPDGTGLFVTDVAGHVFTRGRAHYHGGAPALPAGEIITTMAVTPDGGGYWLFSNRGRVFHFGNAGSFGDESGRALNGPIVAAVATPDGGGYYMVGSDGGIFTHGNAKFHGSEGGKHLNAPIVGIAPTPDGLGYWLVGGDGGIFSFGTAHFRGSTGGQHLNAPVNGVVAFGNGYLLVASDGGVFDFSNKAFLGSLGGTALSARIIAISAFSFAIV